MIASAELYAQVLGLHYRIGRLINGLTIYPEDNERIRFRLEAIRDTAIHALESIPPAGAEKGEDKNNANQA